jgi:hypothetical protein
MHITKLMHTTKVLKYKTTVINRAPMMMAWSTVVAENMGFQREEALSIGMVSQSFIALSNTQTTLASVYTEMNAKSKGVSLGIYKEGAQLSMEAQKGGSQSYIEIMGRR